MNTSSQKSLRQRKLLLVLPLLVLPFMTFMFWALGGGKANADKKTVTSGLDLSLPTPHLKNNLEDKLSLYEQAAQKARQLQAAQKADPYTDKEVMDRQITSWSGDTNDLQDDTMQVNSMITPNETAVTEAKLRRQLAALNAALHSKAETGSNWELSQTNQHELPEVNDQQPDHENIVPATSPVTPDPELQQLDNMLNKILDIEHPERVKTRLQLESQNSRGLVYPVEMKPDVPRADLLQPAVVSDSGQDTSYFEAHTSGNTFYESGSSSVSQNETAIPAVVNETQTLVSGSTIKLRFLQSVFINGIEVPAGNFIYGTCSLDGERLTVVIKHIRYKDALLPVNLSVYDMDGMEGIHIPGAITRDAAKQGIGQGVQSLDFYGMDPSIGAQAASAGIQTVKSLLGGKAKLIKATVPAGYPVLLLDNNKHN
ncbi:MAG: conjugative transposon protein TraM [Chitinophagaceae bacterium]|nr:MAG: conjugative transposon protein TraM [Chitinophagaceae bacterium]